MSIHSSVARRAMSTSKLACRAWSLLFAVVAAGLVAVFGPAPSASAHGEEAQQAFERTSTVLFYDVKFSRTNINLNDELTITGTMRVMNAWPDHTIKPPRVGFLSVSAPGPVVVVKERWLSEQFTPQAVGIQKGASYPFKIVIRGRVPGKWHIHPSFAVKGTGTLVGPGQYVTINDRGKFTAPVTLANGQNIDLESFGLGRVIVWQGIAFLVGAVWLFYWVRKPILQRAAEITEGNAKALITPQHRKVGVIFAVLSLAIGALGLIYSAAVDGPTVPLQVNRIVPRPEAPSALANSFDAHVNKVGYDQANHTLTIDLSVTNRSSSPVRLERFQLADTTFMNPQAVGGAVPPGVQTMSLSSPEPVAPGATKQMLLTINSKDLETRALIPLHEAQTRVTGLLFFKDQSGQRTVSEVNELTAPVIPKLKK